MSSGESTPAPPGGGTDPLWVGTQFVKKYYHVLSTSPADIDKFYKNSTSIVTRGEGSNIAEIVETDFSDGAVAARFLNSDDEQIRFEFEHGAIDAQFSVNSAILLVATGQVVYVTSQIRKSFVHTFFLGSTVGPNSSKRFYVHNDILRFLATPGKDMEGASDFHVHDAPIMEEASAVVLTAKIEEPEIALENYAPPVVEKELTLTDEIPKESNGFIQPAGNVESAVIELVSTDTHVSVLENNDAPGNGVEESKDAILDDEVTAETKATSAPATPGSWASLVKRTATTSAVSPPATPMRPEKANASVNGAHTMPQQSATTSNVKAIAEPSIQPNVTAGVVGTTASSTPPVPATSDVNNNKTAANSSKQQAPPHQQFRPKREAECTLIIKNIDMDVTETEIRAMFEPFTADTSANYVGCTVQGHRGIAFVDFDTPEPVVKAVKKHEEVKFTIRGRELDIYQKIFVERNRGGGGRFQGNSNGRDYYRGGGGGSDGSGRNGGRNFRRSSGRAGGRSASGVAVQSDN